MTNKIAIKYNKKNICRLPRVQETNVQREDVIYGINYIDAEYWNEAKKHITVQNKIKDGIIEEVKTTVKEKTIEKKVIKKSKDKDGKEVEKETTEKEKIELKVTDFAKMKPEEKQAMILDTYKIDSLVELKRAENDPEIRYQIEKRIDEIKNAKTDKTIDHPESHLKN